MVLGTSLKRQAKEDTRSQSQFGKTFFNFDQLFYTNRLSHVWYFNTNGCGCSGGAIDCVKWLRSRVQIPLFVGRIK